MRRGRARIEGAARTWVLLTFGIVVALLTVGCHLVVYSKALGGRKVCLVTKDKPGFADTFVSAPNELKLALQHPVLAARLAAGSGLCVDL